MAVYNVFVKLLDGTTATLKFPTPTISIDNLKSHLQTLTQIPPHHQRLITGTKQLHDQTLIQTHDSPTIHLLLRLLGGKGGFGSLLRGAANKAGQKKTMNFDACRDMNGRRLRHVNAEKKLEEWKNDEEERKLERKAEEFLKKNRMKVKKSGGNETEKYVKKAREDSDKCREIIDASVREGFGKSVEVKRKLLPSSGPSLKRLKVDMKGKEKDEDGDSDSDSDDEDEDGDGEGSSRSVLEGPLPDTGSSDAGSSQTNSEEENAVVNSGSASVEIEVEENGVDDPKVEVENAEGNVHLGVEVEVAKEVNGVCSDDPKVEVENAEGNVPLDVAKETNGVCSDDSSPKVEERLEENDGEKEVAKEVAVSVVESVNEAISDKPLDFGDYNSAAEMEVLGMDRLKTELQAHGLKCGGTLQERAARLFLLKTTPVEKLPKKLLAKK